MNKVVSIGSALVFGVTASVAQAQEPIQEGYLGVSHSFLTYEEDGFAEDFDLGALIAQAGARFNPYVAAELRAGIGTYDHTISSNGASLSAEVDYLVGGYGLVGIPTETPIYPYVIAGMTQGKLSASASGPGGSASVSESESDFSYGVGAKVSVTDKLALTAEYLQYFDESDYEISGITVGGQVKF